MLEHSSASIPISTQQVLLGDATPLSLPRAQLRDMLVQVGSAEAVEAGELLQDGGRDKGLSCEVAQNERSQVIRVPPRRCIPKQWKQLRRISFGVEGRCRARWAWSSYDDLARGW